MFQILVFRRCFERQISESARNLINYFFTSHLEATDELSNDLPSRNSTYGPPLFHHMSSDSCVHWLFPDICPMESPSSSLPATDSCMNQFEEGTHFRYLRRWILDFILSCIFAISCLRVISVVADLYYIFLLLYLFSFHLRWFMLPLRYGCISTSIFGNQLQLFHHLVHSCRRIHFECSCTHFHICLRYDNAEFAY